MISSRVVSFFDSANARQRAATSRGSSWIRTLARPFATVFSPGSGSMLGSGPSGSWSCRSRFQSCSRNLIAVCPLTCASLISCASSAASASVSPTTNVAAGRISRSSGVRPCAARRPLTSALNALPSSSVECREKIASARAAANSRPSFESPAWKITGRPCGLRGTPNVPLMSNCESRCANCPAWGLRRNSPEDRSATMSSLSHESHSSTAFSRNCRART